MRYQYLFWLGVSVGIVTMILINQIFAGTHIPVR